MKADILSYLSYLNCEYFPVCIEGIDYAPKAAMSNPRPSRRFCAAQFRFSL